MNIALVVLLPLISALREYTIKSKSDRQVVVRGRGEDDTLLYVFALNKSNVPTLTIRGSKDDKAVDDAEKQSVEQVQYVLSGVRETIDGGAAFSMDAMAGGKTSLRVVKEEANYVEIEAVITHPTEKDVAGNEYALEVLATLDGKTSSKELADGVGMRISVCNFPYRYSRKGRVADRSKLLVEQVFVASGSASRAGRIQVDENSARDDGNPGSLGSVQLMKADDLPSDLSAKATSAEKVVVEFYSNRPKKAVFSEILTLNATALPDSENGRNLSDSDADDDKKNDTAVKAQATNSASRVMGGAAVAVAALAAVLLC